MSWVVTAYLLTQTIATVLGGKFGDLFGRKWIFHRQHHRSSSSAPLCAASRRP